MFPMKRGDTTGSTKAKAFLALVTVTLLFALKSFGNTEKESRRAAEAWSEGIPHADLGNGYFRNPV